MSKPHGYSVHSYGAMIENEPRMSAYADALRHAITPGCTVIDIGAGTGIFSLLACKYGAGNVIAIEPNDAIELLKSSARSNGFEERITTFQDISFKFVPTQPAQVIVSDIRGTLPLYQNHIETIKDARTRLLAPDGIIIPARDILRIAIVSYPKAREARTRPWLENSFGLNLSEGHSFAVNESEKACLSSEDLLSAPFDLIELDYRSIDSASIQANVMLNANRSGVADGLLVWFDTELCDGIGFSNAPGQPELVYGQTFFPFEHSVKLNKLDRVEVKFSANMTDGEYLYSWVSKFLDSSEDKPTDIFRQSQLLASAYSANTIARRSENYVPLSSQDIEVDRFILAMINGHNTQGNIARAVLEAFPQKCPGGYAAALTHVANVSARYQ